MLTAPKTLDFTLPDFGQPESAHRVSCTQWGEAAHNLLCVHGLTRNGRDFDFLARALMKDYRIFCPDMPGRGQSEWLKNPTGYNYPAYVLEIQNLLMQLGISRADWVGTSMGGIIGMMMANAAPGLIRALVLNDIGTVISAAGIRRIMESAAPQTGCPTRAQAEATLRERCADFGIPSEAHWQHLFTHGLEERDGCWRAAYDPAIMVGYAENRAENAKVADLDLWALWEGVTKIPVLLIRGADSDILSRETAQQMKARHPNLTLHEIPHAGHAPALMDPSQITVIQEWLRAIA